MRQLLKKLDDGLKTIAQPTQTDRNNIARNRHERRKFEAQNRKWGGQAPKGD